jgi:hypothetical protein
MEIRAAEPRTPSTAGAPSISASESVDASADPPTFEVEPGENDFFAVELATRAELFDGQAHSDDRTPQEFYPIWETEAPPMQNGTEYTPPDAIWDRLMARSPDRVYYRVHTSSAADSWEDWQVSTPDPQATQAPSVRIQRGALLEASVGTGGQNRPEDVRALRQRLVDLGFDWLDVTDGVTSELTRTINLVQSIVRGRHRVSGDGRVDVPGETYAWLTAENSPRWRELPVGSRDGTEGFYNFQVDQQPTDDHSHGTGWLEDTIREAGTTYQHDYRSDHPNAAPLTINDAAPHHGGDTPDHAGHETGLSMDLRLPRTDGSAGGITVDSADYDRDAMRAQLEALRVQQLHDRVFLNDQPLVDEGLCTHEPGHANHAHVEIHPPERRGGIERGEVEPTEPTPED